MKKGLNEEWGLSILSLFSEGRREVKLLGVPRTGDAFGLSSFSQRFECPVR